MENRDRKRIRLNQLMLMQSDPLSILLSFLAKTKLLGRQDYVLQKCIGEDKGINRSGFGYIQE